MPRIENAVRYWINVVSFEHVRTGVQLGITQSCHGKSAPLKRMQKGDWIVHYSPKEQFMGKEACQKFTSIGQVLDEQVYQFDMGNGFIPWRRNIRYLESTPIPIVPLLPELSFTKDRGNKWGAMFRYGFFEMTQQDFSTLYSKMVGTPFTPEEKQNFPTSEKKI